METQTNHVLSGDLVQLIDREGNTFIFVVTPGEELHTHRGILTHDSLIDHPWGKIAETHTGYRFLVLAPSLGDILLRTKRSTQIMYPKDIGFILVNMGIGAGKHVIEAGTGSGALTTAFAYMVGPTGRIYSYESRPEMQLVAIKNIERLNLADRVEFKRKDISNGFDERNVDAVFLDVPNPEDFMPQIREALAPGKPFGCLVPTANQVSRVLHALEDNNFGFTEVCETFLRYYKPVPERLRPVDRMVAHTGYLVFARPFLDDVKLIFSNDDRSETQSLDEE